MVEDDGSNCGHWICGDTMRAFAIVLKDNHISETGYKNLRASHEQVKNDFPLVRYNAVTPIEAHDFFHTVSNQLRWTWPWEGEQFQMELGLKMKAYQTRNPAARVACFLSHYNLWKKARDKNETILILEHDALFLQKVPEINMKFGAMSINDPRGATRKSGVYHDNVQKGMAINGVVPCPYVDSDTMVPQGLPGNSAYIISPKFASEVIDFVHKHGAWPNDATICRQNFPGKLYCLQNYATTIQRMPSTTTT